MIRFAFKAFLFKLKSISTNKIALLLILVIGAVLRFYNYSQIPFTHDEFSALFRTGFTDFESLIDEGVLVDFHPAGVQVFLNYYGAWFGYTEWILKLPFTLLGIGSIYLCFLVGKEWFNERTGLLGAAFLSCTQFFVFYSQIARPYSAGLFFGLLAILFWRRFLFSGNSAPLKSLIGWVLSAAICAYIHYYLLLSLVILGLIGLLFSPKERRPLYILSGLLIFTLYLPHLQIFLHQSSKGGVGSWLGAPEISFVNDFSSYLLQHSYIFGGFVLLVLIVGFIRNPKTGRNWWLAFSFFALSLLFGFLYSHFLNPILQFSGLIFSTPLLILALFFWASFNKWLFRISLFGILIFGSYALIFDREHYSVFYQSPYEYLVKDLKNSMENQPEKTLTILNDRRDILKYYLEKYQLDSNSVWLAEHKSSHEFQQIIANSKAEKLYLGAFSSSPPELIALAQEYFPKIEMRKSYFQGEYYVFSKEKKENSLEIVMLEEELNFKTKNEFWKKFDPSQIQELDPTNTFLNIPTGNSYNPSFEILNPKTLFPSSNIFIDLKFELENKSNWEGVFCVLSLEEKGKLIQWYAKPISEFMMKSDSTKVDILHSLAINEKILKKQGLKVKGFLYNKNKKGYKVLKASFQIRSGNPKLYSLFTPVGI